MIVVMARSLEDNEDDIGEKGAYAIGPNYPPCICIFIVTYGERAGHQADSGYFSVVICSLWWLLERFKNFVCHIGIPDVTRLLPLMFLILGHGFGSTPGTCERFAKLKL
ncbi:hypothetical protein M8C21_026055 [Ambrosia artemisiifolia]|uniref:Uncharacterized protein n=1 Tax=Ambrosia artemisiifolia TaxID=4212 RepID=A0AAD5BKZ4_AMBAR|nr:hypothetical protein M8C21_026055 [Ambrosia artemisiifolia]